MKNSIKTCAFFRCTERKFAENFINKGQIVYSKMKLSHL